MTLLRAIGLMSGTSMDGVDVAFIETDGESQIRLGNVGFFPYVEEERALLRRALVEAATIENRRLRPPAVAEAEEMVTRRHAEAVKRFMDKNRFAAADVDVLGFHGQTVMHKPNKRLTVQIGDGEALAAATGLVTVHDFRANDVARGGQGAPLVPAFHSALCAAAGFARPALVVNIGGVSNVTFCAPGAPPIACDAGPGNALIDDLMLARAGVAIDRDGRAALSGTVDQAALEALLADPFFAAPPPKSLDRASMSGKPVEDLPTDDAAATLSAFTAEAIARALKLMPAEAAIAVVCGGGARNAAIMGELERRLPCRVAPASDFGWSIDAMEAQAFAYLAVRRLKDLPISFPTTTGVEEPLTGGVIARPS
ncbi:anhydro-N-acetylmuramic acid kinase [Methylocella sp.]|uniref:anhydro-N-acetylmuramic acid kinase n=1 Tax=Methylocella sp. TaxID=1978226 RepID=UPI003784BF3A